MRIGQIASAIGSQKILKVENSLGAKSFENRHSPFGPLYRNLNNHNFIVTKILFNRAGFAEFFNVRIVAKALTVRSEKILEVDYTIQRGEILGELSLPLLARFKKIERITTL